MRKLCPSFAVLLLLGSLCAPLPGVHAATEPLLLVVGATFPATDISFADVKTAFRGRSVSVRGARLIPINHALGSPLRVAFDRVVLGLGPSEVGPFWIDQRIRDTGRPPTTAPTANLALRAAATLRGAITYATHSVLLPNLKVLTVDGQSASSPDYALRN